MEINNKYKLKIHTDSVLGLTTQWTKRLLKKVSSALGRCYDELTRDRINNGKIDRENCINEDKMKEDQEIERFIIENLENELREFAMIDHQSFSDDFQFFDIIDVIED
ncbi:hypothetical protein M0804_014184 [Polistes exclamans]|nr:hypothetical protein M0804_014192 [Polistes exclamans]KAI4475635.1 hypothetical protein M0804_014184 [Polistes exclamans]